MLTLGVNGPKVVGFKCTIHSEEDEVALTVAQCEQTQILN